MNLSGTDSVTQEPIELSAEGDHLHVRLSSGMKTVRQDAVASLDIVDGLRGPTALIRGPVSLDVVVSDRLHAERFAAAVLSPDPVEPDHDEESLAGYVRPSLPPSLVGHDPLAPPPPTIGVAASPSPPPIGNPAPATALESAQPSVSLNDVLAAFAERSRLPAQLMSACLVCSGAAATVGLTIVVQRAFANPDRMTRGALFALISGGFFAVIFAFSLLGALALCLRFISMRNAVTDYAATRPLLGPIDAAGRYSRSYIRFAPHIAIVVWLLGLAAASFSFDESGFRALLWFGAAIVGPLTLIAMQLIVRTLSQFTSSQN